VVEQAVDELRAAGLVLGRVRSAPAPGHNAGEIVEQVPSDGQDVPQGSAVDVTVADNGAPTPVPTPDTLPPGNPSPGAPPSF
jgi:beta-lactam-binding protein with PASTA domain